MPHLKGMLFEGETLDGYLADAAKGDALFEALLKAGRDLNAAPGAVNQIRRIESGILSWGVDITPAENPYELGMGRLVELGSGADFIGRSALGKLSEAPPARRLVGLNIDGDPLQQNEEPWALNHADGGEVGRLNSLAWSPGLQRNIGLGLVAAAYSNIGTVLSVDTWDGPRSAMIAPLPFAAKKQQGDARALV